MNRRLLLGAVAGAAMLGGPAIGTAATTVTFQVPVSVRGLAKGVNKVAVVCWILDKGKKGIGHKQVTFPVRPGQTYVRTVSVPVTLIPQAVSKAVSWKCALGLNPKINGMLVPWYNAPSALNRAKAGTPLKTEIQGTFSRRLMMHNPQLRGR
ncbi:MAG: hypothetical protein P8090_17925 [Gammaproteobacteria bacterium]